MMIFAASRQLPGLVGQQWLLFGAALALMPDLDIIPDVLFGTAIHHGPTHSLVFAVPVALLAADLVKRTTTWFSETSYARVAAMGFLFYCSHLAVDLITLDNGAPFGMPLLWPIFGGYFDIPLYFIPNVLHSSNAFGLHNIDVVLREVALFGLPLLFMVLFGNGILKFRRIVTPIAFTAYLTSVLVLLARSNPHF